ncbi:MAG: Rne/Rng family ribonuclease [bacterium]
MKKEILANSSKEETRIALLEDSKLVELFFEQQETIKLVGNIYKGTVNNTVPGISSAFIDIGLQKNGYLFINDALHGAPQIYSQGIAAQSKHKEYKIESMLKKGQEVMVQIDKEAMGDKGVKLTMDISLPGRNIVYLPFQNKIGISRHIESRQERDRLKKLVMSNAKSGGFIIRTEAEDVDEKDLLRELNYLFRLWKNILKEYHRIRPKNIVHKDLGLAFQMVRDILSEEVSIYLIDSKDEYNAVSNFLNIVSPELKNRVQFYQSKVPLFEAYNVEKEIDSLRRSKIRLPSGGSIIIQEAESLCAIDVNTGKFVGSTSQEHTTVTTNIEAAREIARQLRLRNIGGIIVIDFIDMKHHKNRLHVVSELKKAVAPDKSKIKILPITRLGLVEMTRQRKRESIQSYISDECPECKGSGKILSTQSMYIKIVKDIRHIVSGRTPPKIKIVLHPDMAQYFRERIPKIERNFRTKAEISENYRLPRQDYQIIIGE